MKPKFKKKSNTCKLEEEVKMPVTRAKDLNVLIQIESMGKALPKGGNSNTGNLATRVSQNSAVSTRIFQIPEPLLLSLW